jgi:hypothetical protein
VVGAVEGMTCRTFAVAWTQNRHSQATKTRVKDANPAKRNESPDVGFGKGNRSWGRVLQLDIATSPDMSLVNALDLIIFP